MPHTFDLSRPAELMGALAPEMLLMGGAMVLLLIAAWGPESRVRARLVGILALALTAACGLLVLWMWASGARATAGMIAVDRFRWAVDVAVLLATIIAIALSLDYDRVEEIVIAESHVLILLASAGMMLLVAARDLIMVFLGIELMSVAVYVLAGLNRRSSRAAEASLKYFLLGAFSTGFLLYGIALVYGATGSTDLGVIGTRVTGATFAHQPMLLVGIALLLIGFGFKVAAVPFHMWTPDVYEGAPTPVTAYMAAAVKAAAFAAFFRVWQEALPGALGAWHASLWWLAVLSMVVGNVVALVQRNVKRMLAYSSIAHAGYLLVAIVSHTLSSLSAFVFYAFAYTLATMGAFAVVIAVGEPGERHQQIGDFAGLWSVRPWLAAAMTVFMLALLGFPVVGGIGFFAKWYIIQAALDAPRPETVLAVVLVLTSVVSAGYYLGVVIAMYMRPRPADAPAPRAIGAPTALTIYATAFALLFFGIFPARVLWLAQLSRPGRPVAAAVAASPPVAAVTGR